jgi:uncharacterized membrane protein YkvA (DUF1232 family)
MQVGQGTIVSSEAKQNESISALRRLSTRSAQTLRAVVLDIRCLYFVFRNPGTPWYARALLFLPLAYLCSPVQLIPNFIPVLGQMDDLFVIWLTNKLVRRLVDISLLNECRERAAAVSFSIGFSGKSFYARHDGPATLEPATATNAVVAEGLPGADSAPVAKRTDLSAATDPHLG